MGGQVFLTTSLMTAGHRWRGILASASASASARGRTSLGEAVGAAGVSGEVNQGLDAEVMLREEDGDADDGEENAAHERAKEDANYPWGSESEGAQAGLRARCGAADGVAARLGSGETGREETHVGPRTCGGASRSPHCP